MDEIDVFCLALKGVVLWSRPENIPLFHTLLREVGVLCTQSHGFQGN